MRESREEPENLKSWEKGRNHLQQTSGFHGVRVPFAEKMDKNRGLIFVWIFFDFLVAVIRKDSIYLC